MYLKFFVFALCILVSSLYGNTGPRVTSESLPGEWLNHKEIKIGADAFRIRPYIVGPFGAQMKGSFLKNPFELTVGYDLGEWLKNKDLVIWLYKTLGVIDIPIDVKNITRIMPDLGLCGLTFKVSYKF